MGHLAAADLSKHPFALRVGAETIHTRTLIIASGASARWLGLPSEQALIGHGVSSCATCDGFFFSGKEIAVVGGGDSAMEEALFLTRFASKVTLLHRSANTSARRTLCWSAPWRIRRSCSAPTRWWKRCWASRDQEVKGVRLRDTATGEQEILPISGLFLGIGHEPNARMFAGQIDLDEDGYVKTTDYVFTRAPGVFACGDVMDRRYRQAITAAGTGCMAALEVEKFLEEHGR